VGGDLVVHFPVSLWGGNDCGKKNSYETRDHLKQRRGGAGSSNYSEVATYHIIYLSTTQYFGL